MSRLIGADKGYTRAYTTIAVIALVSMVLPLFTRLPKDRVAVAAGHADVPAGTRR